MIAPHPRGVQWSSRQWNPFSEVSFLFGSLTFSGTHRADYRCVGPSPMSVIQNVDMGQKHDLFAGSHPPPSSEGHQKWVSLMRRSPSYLCFILSTLSHTHSSTHNRTAAEALSRQVGIWEGGRGKFSWRRGTERRRKKNVKVRAIIFLVNYSPANSRLQTGQLAARDGKDYVLRSCSEWQTIKDHDLWSHL